MIIRNNRVLDLRSNILKRISDLASDDIKNEAPWEWRYDKMTEVKYDTMLYSHFFDPLCASTFYENLEFLDGEDVC